MRTTPNYFHRLALLLLILLGISGFWPPAPTLAQEQTPSARFTESLRFQAIEPGIEYAQTTLGQMTKDEQTGPWFINTLRIDRTTLTGRRLHYDGHSQ